MSPILMSKDEWNKRCREVIEEHLEAGDTILVAVMGQMWLSFLQMIAFGPLSALKTRIFYIGLTDKSLLLVEHDAFDHPVALRRYSRTEVKSATTKHGLTLDRLVLDVGEEKPYKLQVPRSQREQTDQIASQLAAVLQPLCHNGKQMKVKIKSKPQENTTKITTPK